VHGLGWRNCAVVVSLIGSRPQLVEPREGLRLQRRGLADDLPLRLTLEARCAPVERVDQFAQVGRCPFSFRLRVAWVV